MALKNGQDWLWGLDKKIQTVAVLFLVILVFTQLFLFFDESRIFFSKIDKLEGEKVALELTPDKSDSTVDERSVLQQFYELRKGRKMQIKILTGTGTNVYVRINGNKADALTQGQVTVTVYDGDYVEIDATLHSELISYKIVKVEPDIVSPFAGAVFESRGNVVPIGRIKLKR